MLLSDLGVLGFGSADRFLARGGIIDPDAEEDRLVRRLVEGVPARNDLDRQMGRRRDGFGFVGAAFDVQGERKRLLEAVRELVLEEFPRRADFLREREIVLLAVP